MRERRITVPELFVLAATRGMIGLGIGLLISGRLDADRRKIVGSTLLAVGALSTIPIAWRVFGRQTNHRRMPETPAQEYAGT